MPQLLPLIAAAVSIAGTGIGTGLEVSGALNGPTPTPTTPAPTPPNPQELLQKKEAVSQQLPNVLGATSGLANPDYDKLIAELLSGVLGQPGANAAGGGAVGQQFTQANNTPTNAAVSGQNINLSDFINSAVA